jgi:hypothetical protein
MPSAGDPVMTTEGAIYLRSQDCIVIAWRAMRACQGESFDITMPVEERRTC